MRVLSREAWNYAFLLIVLFAIASIAVWQALQFLEPRVTSEVYHVTAAVIWAITLGFMFIAGAFGIWAVQFAAEAESRRRISLLVHSMTYLRDGIVAVDRKGRIAGANPAALELTTLKNPEGALLTEMFSCLGEPDLNELINTAEPVEVERPQEAAPAPRTLRFRSQPSEGVVMILISDVTNMSTQRQHLRQAARLQLIGQIARGVATDFNDLFCAIAGHAALLSRTRPGTTEWPDSIGAITRAVDRGCALAEHIRLLSQSEGALVTAGSVQEALQAAASALRDGLPAGWQVEDHILEIPSVALSRSQMEQVVLNLGLIAADAARTPGVLRITASAPRPEGHFNVAPPFAGVVLVEASGIGSGPAPASLLPAVSEPTDEGGLILLVVRSIVEDAGGVVDCLGGSGTCCLYRVALPPNPALASVASSIADLPAGLSAYVAKWSTLVAAPEDQSSTWTRPLEQVGAGVARAGSIVAALARVEQMPRLDAVIVDVALFAGEEQAMLRSLLKLRPEAAIVAVGDATLVAADPLLSSELAFLPREASGRELLFALMDAKSRAAKRRPPTAHS